MAASYSSKVRAAFKKLEVAPCKHAKFGKRLIADALALQKRSFERHPDNCYSLNAAFYSYALLDPTKPGRFTYKTEEGKRITFDYEPFYVGKGTRNRCKAHANYEARSTWVNPKLTRIRKLQSNGLEPIIVKLSAPSIEAYAYAVEIAVIKAVGRLVDGTGPLTNLTLGGGGVAGTTYVKTVEHIEKITQANTGKKRSPEFGTRISALLTGIKRSDEFRETVGKFWRNKPKSEAHIEKIRLANTGKTHSEETKNKLRSINTGKRASAETRAKISLANFARYTPELSARLSAAQIARYDAIGRKPKKPRIDATVVCPVCKTEGGLRIMKRWHFNNCRKFL